MALLTIASELSWGICEQADNSERHDSDFITLSHSLFGIKLRVRSGVYAAFQKVIAWAAAARCACPRTPEPRRGVVSPHLGSNPAPCPLPVEPWAGYLHSWVQIPISGMRQMIAPLHSALYRVTGGNSQKVFSRALAVCATIYYNKEAL